MKKRSVILALLFSVLTFGIYYVYWFVSVTNQSNRLAPKNATAGGFAALLFSIFTGGIYHLYWSYRFGQKAGEMLDKTSDAFLYLLLDFFTVGIVSICMGQSAVNKAVDLKRAENIAAINAANAERQA